MGASWDTIVIGSGSGGLTAAVALARAGQHVLVVEQRYLPGGSCQSFSLEGYRFSPGVRHVGELGPGGGLRRIYEGLGLSDDLEFCEMNPEGFDHLLIEGERFDVPRGFARYFARLCARFPHEREGLERYFATLHRVREDGARRDEMLSFPAVLGVPFAAPTALTWGLRSHGALLDRTIRDPLLHAVLAAPSGHQGLAPSRVALLRHAAAMAQYYGGAFYPRGGAKRIPLALIKALRRRGGQIRLRARVRQILVTRGRVSGVELCSGERIAASNVISCADPAVTFGELLAPEGAARGREGARRGEPSVSLLDVYCAVEMDLRRLGYDSGNYWWYRHRDDASRGERSEERLPEGRVDRLCLAITTLKDPGHRHDGRHTLEMFAVVPHAPDERGPEYERFKEALGDRVVAAAEEVIPGLQRAMRFRSVSSPPGGMGHSHDEAANANGHRSRAGGTAWPLGAPWFGGGDAVPGLHLCGVSGPGQGVAAAAMTGLTAAQKVLHAEDVADLLGPADGSLRVYPADEPETWLRGVPSLTPHPPTGRGDDLPSIPRAYASRGEGRGAAPRRG